MKKSRKNVDELKASGWCSPEVNKIGHDGRKSKGKAVYCPDRGRGTSLRGMGHGQMAMRRVRVTQCVACPNANSPTFL